jgi:E3 ubiquitin-protein ligase SIAH1
VINKNAFIYSCEIKNLGSSSEIVKLLECPICRSIPIPPIWNCLSGHIACDHCHSRMNVCGLCRRAFASDGRNLFMEAVISDCDLTCPFAENGCKEIFKGNVMPTHASECQYG